jgi:ATP-dependent Clp protease ATP-binding subunit ClpA
VADFSALVAQMVQSAWAEAQQQNSSIVGTPHLFIALTKLNGDAAAALRGQGHDPKHIRDELRAALGPGQAAPGAEPKLTARAAQNLQRAKELAEAEGVA